MSTEKEDGVCENKLCNDLDAQCSISNRLTQSIGLSVSNNNTDNNVSICANCGKEDVNNTCNKCKMVRYCNAACKKKHRHKHKKDCEEHLRLAAEHAAKEHDIELFKQPPPLYGDCPICFLRMPTFEAGSKYQSCCGKVICSGCLHAPVYDNQGNKVDIFKQNECPFCRVVAPIIYDEMIERLNKRMEAEDPIAIYNQGNYYRDGRNGLPQDHTKALELWHRAAELGHAEAYSNIGYAHEHGEGVEVDKKKAIHYYERAAMRGDEIARENLGNEEIKAGNFDRALKHYMIATKGGADSLKKIQHLYSNGHATRDDYTKALRLYQEYLSEIKSVQRDKAAATYENCRYY